MIEVVCFEKDHRFVKSETHDGYTCRNCRIFIPMPEFQERANTGLQSDVLVPLRLCDTCGTWHCPQEFDVNAVLARR